MKKNGFNVLWATFLCLSLHICSYVQAENQQEKDYVAYLFAYFTGNNVEQEAIHFAVSEDGYNYKEVGS